MKTIFTKAALVSLACVVLKWSAGAVIAPVIHADLNPANWFIFLISPVLVAMPVAGFIFWQDDKLRKAMNALENAHRQLTEAHRMLGEKARHDHMTGLLTREALHAALEGKSGALLIVDADRFKQINDNFGHLAGDQALREISSAISGVLRQSDMAARIGGEEFAVFLDGVNPAQSERIAERIRLRVAAIRFSPEPGTEVKLTVSIGGAAANKDTPFHALIDAADRRLYEAKDAGRNRSVVQREPEPLARAS